MVVATRRSSLRTSSPLQSSSSSSSSASSSSVKLVHEKQADIDRDPASQQEKKDLSDERQESPNIFPTLHRNDHHGKTDSDKLQSPSFSLASSYESLRLQRIAENKARLAALGVQKHAENLTSYFSASKQTGKRPWKKLPILPIELRRRSERLKNTSPFLGFYTQSRSYRHRDAIDESSQLQLTTKRKVSSPQLQLTTKTKVSSPQLQLTTKRKVSSSQLQLTPKRKVSRNYDSKTHVKPANASIPKYVPTDLQITPKLSTLRCHSNGRGSLHDAVVGICCHFCRQKKLCGEPDCERCGHRDVTKECVGKTDCSRCHSSTGVFCRACLKIRYGEEMEEVRQKMDWMCPHCIEEECSDPYWICNSSICLAKRKVAPTGIAIFKAREMGYKSVAHYLADVLRKQESGS